MWWRGIAGNTFVISASKSVWWVSFDVSLGIWGAVFRNQRTISRISTNSRVGNVCVHHWTKSVKQRAMCFDERFKG